MLAIGIPLQVCGILVHLEFDLRHRHQHCQSHEQTTFHDMDRAPSCPSRCSCARHRGCHESDGAPCPSVSPCVFSCRASAPAPCCGALIAPDCGTETASDAAPCASSSIRVAQTPSPNSLKKTRAMPNVTAIGDVSTAQMLRELLRSSEGYKQRRDRLTRRGLSDRFLLSGLRDFCLFTSSSRVVADGRERCPSYRCRWAGDLSRLRRRDSLSSLRIGERERLRPR